MIKIGLTGGIGSGKSFVASIFEVLDIPVYYADHRSKQLLFKDRTLKKQIKDLLGSLSYHKNGRPNKSFIAQKIFNDKKLLKKMNALVHPRVKLDFENWSENQIAPYVIEESAILFEINAQKNFDAIILVTANKELRLKRVMKRDGITRDMVLDRMKNQFPDDKKIALADFIIDNNGNKSILQQVYNIHNQIIKLD